MSFESKFGSLAAKEAANENRPTLEALHAEVDAAQRELERYRAELETFGGKNITGETLVEFDKVGKGLLDAEAALKTAINQVRAEHSTLPAESTVPYEAPVTTPKPVVGPQRSAAVNQNSAPAARAA